MVGGEGKRGKVAAGCMRVCICACVCVCVCVCVCACSLACAHTRALVCCGGVQIRSGDDDNGAESDDVDENDPLAVRTSKATVS